MKIRLVKQLGILSFGLAGAVLLLLGFAAAASGTTIVALNTGYKHQVFAPYPPAPPAGPDSYWINIASYPPTSPLVGTSWVLPLTSAWPAPFPATHWISARPGLASPSGTSVTNPAYTIFRKCFCLYPNFKNPSLNFLVRADDNIQVWFNTILNVALPPTNFGNWASGPPLQSLPSNPAWFRVGKNCIYVLLEDTGGFMGFDLEGTIQADGLAPFPALGVAQTFECGCRGAAAAPTARKAGSAADDQEVVRQIVKLAEERRLKRAVARGAQEPRKP